MCLNHNKDNSRIFYSTLISEDVYKEPKGMLTEIYVGKRVVRLYYQEICMRSWYVGRKVNIDDWTFQGKKLTYNVWIGVN